MRGKKVKMVIKMRKGEKFNDLVDVEALWLLFMWFY